MKRGLFITFEGGEGAGKSTQILHLAQALRASGQDVLTTREPGGTPLGERLRALLLARDYMPDALTQTLLFAAARADHVHQVIRPALARGVHVLCDRFSDSTLAYQGGAVSEAVLAQSIALATGGLAPDITFLLDLPPQIGLARAKMRRETSIAQDSIPQNSIAQETSAPQAASSSQAPRKTPDSAVQADAFEHRDLAYHSQVRARFLALAQAEPARILVLDAAQPPEAVSHAVLARFEAHGAWRDGAWQARHPEQGGQAARLSSLHPPQVKP